MSLPTPTQTATGTSTTTTGTATFGVATTAGKLLVAAINTHNSSVVPSSITDTAGNTWVKAHSLNAGSFWYCLNPLSITTITVHGLGATGVSASIVAREYPISGATLDKIALASGTLFIQGDPNSGASAVTTQASELIIGWMYDNAGSTPNTITAANPASDLVVVGAGGDSKVAMADGMLSSTGAQTASFNISAQANATWGCGVVTFKTAPVSGSGTGHVTFGGIGVALRTGRGTGNVVFGGSSGTLLVTRNALGTGNVVFGGSSGTLLVTRRATGTGNVAFGGTGTPTAIRQAHGTCSVVFSDTGRANGPGRGRADIRFGARGHTNSIHVGKGTCLVKFRGTGTVLVTHVPHTLKALVKFRGTGQGLRTKIRSGTGNVKFRGTGRGQRIRIRGGKALVKFKGTGRGNIIHKTSKGKLNIKFSGKTTKILITRRVVRSTLFLRLQGGDTQTLLTIRATGSGGPQFAGTGTATFITRRGTSKGGPQFAGTGTTTLVTRIGQGTCLVRFSGDLDGDIRHNALGVVAIKFGGTGSNTLVTKHGAIAKAVVQFAATGVGKLIKGAKGKGGMVFKGTAHSTHIVGNRGQSLKIAFGGTGRGRITRNGTGETDLLFTGDGAGVLVNGSGPGECDLVFDGDGVGSIVFNATGESDLVFEGDGVGTPTRVASAECDIVFENEFPAFLLTKNGTGEVDIVFQADTADYSTIRGGSGRCDLVFQGDGTGTTGATGQCDVKFGGNGKLGILAITFGGSFAQPIMSRTASGECVLQFGGSGATLREGSGQCDVAIAGGDTLVTVTRFGRGECNVIFQDAGSPLVIRTGAGQCDLVFAGSGRVAITHVAGATNCDLVFANQGAGHSGVHGRCDVAFECFGEGAAVKLGHGRCDVAFGGSATTVFVQAPGTAYIQFQGNGVASATRVGFGVCAFQFQGIGTVSQTAFGQCNLIFDLSGSTLQEGAGDCDVIFKCFNSILQTGGGITRIVFGGFSELSSTRVWVQVATYPNTDRTFGLWVVHESQVTLIYVASTMDVILDNILPPGVTVLDRGNGFFNMVGFDTEQWYSERLTQGRITGRRLGVLSTPSRS